MKRFVSFCKFNVSLGF